MLRRLLNININYVLFLLLAVAIGLGVFIYLRDFSVDEVSTASNESENPRVSEESDSMLAKHANPELLSTEERALLKGIGPESSREEQDEYFSLLDNLAVEADEIDIGSCPKPSPFVAKIGINESVRLINTDSDVHSVSFGSQYIEVSAGGSEEAVFEFTSGPGSYVYRCDNLGGIAGFFLVNPN